MNLQSSNIGRKTKSNLNTRKVVEIKAVTWNKDSHGLFDYENSYYDMRKFQIMNSVFLYRSNLDIDYIKKNDQSLNQQCIDSEFLLSINKNQTEKSSHY